MSSLLKNKSPHLQSNHLSWKNINFYSKFLKIFNCPIHPKKVLLTKPLNVENQDPILLVFNNQNITFDNKDLNNVSYFNRKKIINQWIKIHSSAGHKLVGFIERPNKIFAFFQWELQFPQDLLTSAIQSKYPVIVGAQFFSDLLIYFVHKKINHPSPWLIVCYPDPQWNETDQNSFSTSPNWYMVVSHNEHILFQRSCPPPFNQNEFIKDLEETIVFLKRYNLHAPDDLKLVIFTPPDVDQNINTLLSDCPVTVDFQNFDVNEILQNDLENKYLNISRLQTPLVFKKIQQHMTFFKYWGNLYRLLVISVVLGIVNSFIPFYDDTNDSKRNQVAQIQTINFQTIQNGRPNQAQLLLLTIQKVLEETTGSLKKIAYENYLQPKQGGDYKLTIKFFNNSDDDDFATSFYTTFKTILLEAPYFDEKFLSFKKGVLTLKPGQTHNQDSHQGFTND